MKDGTNHMHGIRLNVLTAAFVVSTFAASAGAAAAPITIPPIENLDRLESWRTGVPAADAREEILQVVCIGDSNTEAAGYVHELRKLLQGCYGERGVGYHSLGNRNAVPESPDITRQGKWEFLRDAPNGPPPPRFAMDGIWCRTADPQAEVTVSFTFGGWEAPDYHLARPYNIQQRIRIHHQVGPGLGSFAVFVGPNELRRIDCTAEQAGYAVTDAFLGDGFRIADIEGEVVIFGFDAERSYYLQGEPALEGGVLVHALGKSWGRTEEPAMVEDDAYAAFFSAIKPDLITILLGTNDQHNDGRVENYRGWLTTMIQKLQKHNPGTGILVIACPEAGQTKPGLAAQFRDTAREVAAGNNCAFWDFQALVGPRSATWYKEGFFNDGLHYNAVGGSILARMLLRQLGFDINDPAHYPALKQPVTDVDERPEFSVPRTNALTLDEVAAAVATQPAQSIWTNQIQLAEVRLAVAGDALAVHAKVRDGQCSGPVETWDAGVFELCIANPDNLARVMHNTEGPVVRQVVFKAAEPEDGAQVMVKQYTFDEKNQVVSWETEGEFPFSITPLEPYGYELQALVPLELLVLTKESKQFLLECATVAAGELGGKPTYSRMFATKRDNGAFRDATQSAAVKVE